MLRNLGIALLFLGLLGAGMDGFRVRAHVQTPAASGAVAPTTDDGRVHTAEFGVSVEPK